MGATPNPNPHGNCGVCPWTGDTPQYVFVVLSGIQRPLELPPEFIDYNGMYMLKAVAACKWMSINPCFAISLELGSPAWLLASMDPVCTSDWWMGVFADGLQDGCITHYTNRTDGLDPDWFYTGGSAEAFLGLPGAPADWIPDYGFLPADRWKYEHGDAGAIEQIYIGSRKYKTNCRILFDPSQM